MTNPLDSYRRDAKTLHKAYEAGDKPAIERVQAIGAKGELKRADFLHVIARENTFVSWPAMKEAIERLGLDRAQRQQRLKLALWNGQSQIIKDLVWEDAEVAEGSFGLQCALYQPEVLEALTKEPALATREVNGRRPILHLAFSKAFLAFPERTGTMFAIADALVRAGADVNDSFPAPGDEDHPLSAIYGALGHAGNLDLAAWFLERGADPNDNESLYHATELGTADGVRMLIKAGANPNGTNALKRAMDFDNLEMVELLLGAGADPNEGDDGWTSLHHAALRGASGAICKALLSAGADPKREGRGITAFAAARVYGNKALAELMPPIPMSREEELLATAADGDVPDNAFIDPEKVPPIYLDLVREFAGDPRKKGHIEGLVKLGLPWDRPDSEGLTPVQIAGWMGQPEMLSYFLSLRPDLGHINGYGGTLLSTIIHGSENNPKRSEGDYPECLRRALHEGVALPKRAIRFAGDPDVREFLMNWAQAHPGQVVEHGVA